MGTIEQFHEWERRFAAANGCDVERTIRGSLSFPTRETFSVEVIELDAEGKPRMDNRGELVRTEVTRPIINKIPRQLEHDTTNHQARVERVSYQTFLNTTEITISIPGEHDLERGDNVIITVKEGKR